MSGDRVNPTLLYDLGLDGIDEGEAGLCVSPLVQKVGFLVPSDLNAVGISYHRVVVEVISGQAVEELSPQELSVE